MRRGFGGRLGAFPNQNWFFSLAGKPNDFRQTAYFYDKQRWVGTADTFHLDEAVRLLDAEPKSMGSDARIEYVEGRNHFDLYEGGLSDRIAQEMYAVARPKAQAAAKWFGLPPKEKAVKILTAFSFARSRGF